MQQGLEVVGRGGDARAFGDLEGELAGVHLVEAQANGHDAAGAIEMRRGGLEVWRGDEGRTPIASAAAAAASSPEMPEIRAPARMALT